MPHALILTDGKAGHENQSRAFARALGCEAKLVPVHFKSKVAKAVSYLYDRVGVLSESLFVTETPRDVCFDVVIGTGSGTFYAAKTLAHKLGCRCGVVLYPRGYRLNTFGCILAPAFDRPKSLPNVVRIPANLVAADAAFYAQGRASFAAHYEQATGRPLGTPEGAVAVIVGGPNGCSTLEPAWMKAQLEALFAATPGVPHWVTTSRRTPPAVEAVVDSFPFDYKLLYSRDHFNPIPGFVSLAHTLCVTAESTGMLSESCTFGTAEVRVLDNLKPGPHKFRRFVEDLTREGYVNGNRKIDLSEQFAASRRLLLG